MTADVVTTRRNWTDPETCPFCGATLANGGAAFVDHVAVSDGCAASFDVWREQVAGDVGGEWSG